MVLYLRALSSDSRSFDKYWNRIRKCGRGVNTHVVLAQLERDGSGTGWSLVVVQRLSNRFPYFSAGTISEAPRRLIGF